MSQWNTPHPRLFFAKTTAPTVNDDVGDGACPGSVWVDSTNSKIYQCVVPTRTAAVWLQTAGTGSSPVATSRGQILYSTDGATFTAQTPLASDTGVIITEDDTGYIVVLG